MLFLDLITCFLNSLKQEEEPICYDTEIWFPLSTAPTRGRSIEVEVLCRNGTIKVAHYACDLSGEEQPAYRGWFERVTPTYNSEVDAIAWRHINCKLEL